MAVMDFGGPLLVFEVRGAGATGKGPTGKIWPGTVDNEFYLEEGVIVVAKTGASSGPVSHSEGEDGRHAVGRGPDRPALRRRQLHLPELHRLRAQPQAARPAWPTSRWPTCPRRCATWPMPPTGWASNVPFGQGYEAARRQPAGRAIASRPWRRTSRPCWAWTSRSRLTALARSSRSTRRREVRRQRRGQQAPDSPVPGAVHRARAGVSGRTRTTTEEDPAMRGGLHTTEGASSQDTECLSLSSGQNSRCYCTNWKAYKSQLPQREPQPDRLAGQAAHVARCSAR